MKKKDGILITKDLRKGPEGLAFRIKDAMFDEHNDELGKKRIIRVFEAIASEYTDEDKAAAYKLLLADEAVVAHKRGKMIAKAFDVVNEIRDDAEKTLKDAVEDLTGAAAEMFKADKEKDDDDNEEEPVIKLIDRDKIPVKEETNLSKLGHALQHELEFRPKILKSDMYYAGYKLGRLFNNVRDMVFAH